MLEKCRWIGRSILPSGDNGAAVGIPAKIKRELDLEPGEDGDEVDLEYDREERTMTVHFPEPDDDKRA